MTAKKALEEVRRLIEERKAHAGKKSEEHSRNGAYVSAESYRTMYSAFSEALGCVSDVEKKIHG